MLPDEQLASSWEIAMATGPDPHGDFSVDELGANYTMVTQEVDTPEPGSDRMSPSGRDKESTATEVHGSFLLRDALGS